MIPATTFAGKEVAVFGLGKSGLASAHALIAGGAHVRAHDDDAEACAGAERAGIPVEDLSDADWRRFAALVLAPGVPLTHPKPHWVVGKAKAAGVEIIGDIELFCRERAKSCPEAPFVAVTGTNGKSTTTALIGHILRAAGKDVQVGGNIGAAVLGLAPPTRDRVHVLELSSFQIDLTPSLRPSIGVLLNISPDHLDRHGSMERYAALKERVVSRAARAVIGDDDDWCREISERLRLAQRGWVDMLSAKGRLSYGWYAVGSELVGRAPWAGPLGVFADLKGIGALRGEHNAQNALAASIVAFILGLEAHQVAAALKTFPGLPHRLEEVGRQGRTLFVNDSKATNADSAGKALAAFARDIFWILGGRPKEGGISGLERYFARIAKAYLIGEASPRFAAELSGKLPFEECGSLEKAVHAAARDAAASGAEEPVVLLSPACASFDQFRNFEVRGDAFRTFVARLPGIELRCGATHDR
jgi:UDP-N-acetylmuramoylalanine--D-glutamate ligase